ncbi:MAG: hypothetical protein OES79_03465, partial [Planctomycetota bacterium]|nr:hypothetical protein [Planctomycetota bacterium]
DRIASIVGLTPEEIARIDAAEDKAIRELVLDGIPPGEFFTLAKQIRCPQCGARLTLAPCVTCHLNSTIEPLAKGNRPVDSKSPEITLAPQILLVTADVELRWSISQLLEHSGYDVTHCRSPSSLLDEFAFRESPADVARFDLLMCDERLLDETVLAALQRLGQWQLRPPLVLLSQDGEHVVADVSVRLRASAACARFDLEGQLATVRQIAPLNGSLRQSLRGPPERMTNDDSCFVAK